MKQHEDQIINEVKQFKYLVKVVKNRVSSDILPVPFLFAWSTLICLLLENAPSDKIGSFLQSTFGEGIGLKTIIVMLILSSLLAGLAWLIRPAPGNIIYKMLLAPAGAARSVCITTFAFVMGLAFAIAITNGINEAKSLGKSLAFLVFLWIALNLLETLACEASNNREKKYKWDCIALGLILVFGCLLMMCFLYKEIQSGRFV